MLKNYISLAVLVNFAMKVVIYISELFHDRIVSKNCDDLISLAHYNELSLLMGYEEMKRLTKDLPELVLDKVFDFDLEEILMYCAVNCIENPYIINYIKKRNRRWREY